MESGIGLAKGVIVVGGGVVGGVGRVLEGESGGVDGGVVVDVVDDAIAGV